jgi:hypothetical protein
MIYRDFRFLDLAMPEGRATPVVNILLGSDRSHPEGCPWLNITLQSA